MIRAALCVALLGAALPSQIGSTPSRSVPTSRVLPDDVIAVHRGADRRGRDLLYAQLKKTRIDAHFENLSAVDLARFLTAATGDKLNFVVMAKSDIEPLTLRLKRVAVTTVMDLAQRFSNVRFVYQNGLVLLQPKDEVKEYTSLRIYDVRAATMEIPDFPGPELKLRAPGEEPVFEDPEEPEGNPAGGFTADKMVDLLRSNVLPDSWDRPGVSITEIRGVLYVRQTERGHRKVSELLMQLGAIAPVRVVVKRRGPVGAAKTRKAPKTRPAKTSETRTGK